MLEPTDPDDQTPTPTLVAAWMTLDTLPTESVPLWAASWIIQGYDGMSLSELAGLTGRDPHEVRDILPEALADTGIAPLSSRQAAFKVAYDHIANLHLARRARWTWVLNKVAELVTDNLYADEALEQPLAKLWQIADDPSEQWNRTEAELATIVHRACTEQVQH